MTVLTGTVGKSLGVNNLSSAQSHVRVTALAENWTGEEKSRRPAGTRHSTAQSLRHGQRCRPPSAGASSAGWWQRPGPCRDPLCSASAPPVNTAQHTCTHLHVNTVQRTCTHMSAQHTCTLTCQHSTTHLYTLICQYSTTHLDTLACQHSTAHVYTLTSHRVTADLSRSNSRAADWFISSLGATLSPFLLIFFFFFSEPPPTPTPPTSNLTSKGDRKPLNRRKIPGPLTTHSKKQNHTIKRVSVTDLSEPELHVLDASIVGLLPGGILQLLTLLCGLGHQLLPLRRQRLQPCLHCVLRPRTLPPVNQVWKMIVVITLIKKLVTNWILTFCQPHDDQVWKMVVTIMLIKNWVTIWILILSIAWAGLKDGSDNNADKEVSN